MNSITHATTQGLRALLVPVIRWCVKQGVGYTQFAAFSKSIFYEAAKLELVKNKLNQSTSALSLLAGLHRADVEKFKASPIELNQPLKDSQISISSQIVARWLALNLPTALPLKGVAPSFDQLAKHISGESSGKASPRLLLQDMVRRGLAKVVGNQVELLAVDGATAQDSEAGQQHFTSALHDHMQACLDNQEASQAGGTPKFLEQCLMADGLHPESIELLQAMTRVWWADAVHAVGARAITLSETDEPQGGQERLRFGVYVYATRQSSAGLPAPP